MNDRYEKWIEEYEEQINTSGKGKLLVIDVEDLNFAESPEDLGVVINKIDAEFNGLF